MNDSTLKQAIYNKVAKSGSVSFAELSRLDGFNGDFGMHFGDPDHNIVVWTGASREAVDALNELISVEKVIVMTPASLLVYLIDGVTLNLPLVKRATRYKSLRWLPVVLDARKQGGAK